MLMDSVGQEFGQGIVDRVVFTPQCLGPQLGILKFWEPESSGNVVVHIYVFELVWLRAPWGKP